MTANTFTWQVLFVCAIIVLVNFVRKPQETKERFSTLGFILKSSWEKRKTSSTYKKVSLGWFVLIFLCLLMRYLMITATSQHNLGLAVIILILLVALPLLALILIIYSSYKMYHASKEALANRKDVLTQTKTPFVVYLCDFVYVLAFLLPYCIRFIK